MKGFKGLMNAISFSTYYYSLDYKYNQNQSRCITKIPRFVVAAVPNVALVNIRLPASLTPKNAVVVHGLSA